MYTNVGHTEASDQYEANEQGLISVTDVVEKELPSLIDELELTADPQITDVVEIDLSRLKKGTSYSCDSDVPVSSWILRRKQNLKNEARRSPRQ